MKTHRMLILIMVGVACCGHLVAMNPEGKVPEEGAIQKAPSEMTPPPAPPLPQQKPAKSPKVRAPKKPVLMVQAPKKYEEYRRLAVLLDSDSEKISETMFPYLHTGYVYGIEQTIALDVASMLSQKASPILVHNAYVLENVLLMKYGTELYSKYDPYSFEYNQDVADRDRMRTAIQTKYATMYKNKPVPENSDFFKEYKEFAPPEEEPEKEPITEDNFDITDVSFFDPGIDLSKDFFLYEYHGALPMARAYLLIPRNKESAMASLEKHGFNKDVFQEKNIASLENELKTNLHYSAYVQSGGEHISESQFSIDSLKLMHEVLTAHDKKPWLIYLAGHGKTNSEHTIYELIAGIGVSYFAKGLLPLLVDKNTRFLDILTCDIGATHRDLIRKTFPTLYTPNETLPDFAQQLLGEKRVLHYPNNLIIVLNGISDIWVTSEVPNPLPTKDISLFNKVWNSLDKNPQSLDMRFMPFVPTVRFDYFFSALENHLNTEEQRGTSAKGALIPWKEILKHITPYNAEKDKYLYQNIPQIRFPMHDASFNVVEVDNRIQVLRYVDVKKRELEAKRAHKTAEPMRIEDKDMVLVYPLSINVPLDIHGTYPSIVQARAEELGLFFKKIICHDAKDLQNTLHAFFTFEAVEGIMKTRTFFIQELQLGSTLYKDVLVINTPQAEKEFYPTGTEAEGMQGNGSECGPEGCGYESGSESGSESEESEEAWETISQTTVSEAEYEPYYDLFIRTQVYYRKPDNMVMTYSYDHRMKEKTITIPEKQLAPRGVRQFEASIKKLKEAIEKEEALA